LLSRPVTTGTINRVCQNVFSDGMGINVDKTKPTTKIENGTITPTAHGALETAASVKRIELETV